jgi:hypothetical protein
VSWHAIHWGAVNWDSVEATATAVGALLTGLALLVTVFALRKERANRQEDVARLDRDIAEAAAAQAYLVVVADNDSELGSGIARLVLRNFSERPVYGVVVWPFLDGRRVELTDERKVGSVAEQLLKPGEERTIELVAPYGSENLVSAEVVLRDSAGLRWRRANNGRPERYTD